MQSQTLEQLTPNAAQAILANLPERIRTAFIDRAAEINYPVEALVEMALAGYLDSESITYGRSKTNGFVDCKPNRGRG
jgi:flagellar motor switch protein FliG